VVTKEFLLESLKPCPVSLLREPTGWISINHATFRNALTQDSEGAGSASEAHFDTGKNDGSAAHKTMLSQCHPAGSNVSVGSRDGWVRQKTLREIIRGRVDGDPARKSREILKVDRPAAAKDLATGCDVHVPTKSHSFLASKDQSKGVDPAMVAQGYGRRIDQNRRAVNEHIRAQCTKAE